MINMGEYGIVLMNSKKKKSDISLDVNVLKNLIGDNTDYLESIETLEAIHSTSWTIQLKAERMLRFLQESQP